VRTLGMTRRQIMRQILAEAGMLELQVPCLESSSASSCHRASFRQLSWCLVKR